MSDFIYLSYVFDLGELKNDTLPAARGTETPYFGFFLKNGQFYLLSRTISLINRPYLVRLKKKKKGFLCLEILQRAALVL